MTMEDDCSIYVGGLSYDVTEDELREKFQQFGSIINVKIVVDRDSGNSRGYGFVTFTNSRAAAKAINGMDGSSLGGRIIKVNEATKNSKNGGRENPFRGRGRENRDFRPRDRNGCLFSPHRNRRLSPVAMNTDRSRVSARYRSPSPKGGFTPRRSISPAREIGNDRSSSPSSSPQSLHRSPELAKLGRKKATKREYGLIKMKDELERATKTRDELKTKVSVLEKDKLQKDEQINELKRKSQELEESLSRVVNAAAHRQNQLRKLHKAFLQVRNFSDCLQRSEKELQALVTSASFEFHDTALEIQEIPCGASRIESDDEACHINIED